MPDKKKPTQRARKPPAKTAPKRKPTKRKAPARKRRTRRAEPVLMARDLVKVYEAGGTTTRALDGVSFEIPPGRFVAIMGPSGSGKSTLLHLLGGLDAPTSGDVLWGDQQLSEMKDRDITLARRTQVGFVFQFFNLVPVLSVRENIALPYVIDSRSPASYADRLDELVSELGLVDCQHKLPSEISGGQQQRTAIARALLPSPGVLLCDEPTGNLDTHTGREILALIKAMQTKLAQAVVAVTHDPNVAAFGDEVVFLVDGRIEASLELDGLPDQGSARLRTGVLPPGPRTARAKRSQGGDDARAQAVWTWLQELEA